MISAYAKLIGTDPAANTELSETVAASTRYTLVAFTVSLVQGLTQTPQPILTIDDGTDLLFASAGASAAQGASTTCRYTWGRGLPLTAVIGSGANCYATAPLPENVLDAGYRIKTVTTGIGANSNYGAPTLWVVEY